MQHAVIYICILCPSRYDYESVFKCLSRGVEDAIACTRRTWKMSSNMEEYRKEMDAMAAFTGVVLFPYLRRLEFREGRKNKMARHAPRHGEASNSI